MLKKAGVVDAGGQGLVVILRACRPCSAGASPSRSEELTQNKAKLSTSGAGKGVFTDDLMKVEDITNGYCTQFLVNKEPGASITKLRAFLESNGDSVVVIEDDDVANCHVHTADPGKILSHAIQYGYLTSFKIENMHEQFLARQKQGKGPGKAERGRAEGPLRPVPCTPPWTPSREYGFVSVAAGEGLAAVFADLGVDAVVSGGQTMNPATEGHRGRGAKRARQNRVRAAQQQKHHHGRRDGPKDRRPAHCGAAHPHHPPGHHRHAEL